MKSLIFSVILGHLVFALDLPSFMPKCSIKDPDLNGCIVEKGNIVVPNLVKGVKEFGIEVTSPVRIPEIKVEGKHLRMTLTDVRTDDVKKLRLSKALFDIKSKREGFTAFIDQMTWTGTYSIISGKIQGRSISGTGKLNMTLVGNTINYKSAVDLETRKDGLQYIVQSNPSVELETARGYYQFENLKSSNGEGDINEYIDKHWQIVRNDVKPALEALFLKFIFTPIESFTGKLPLNKVFSP